MTGYDDIIEDQWIGLGREHNEKYYEQSLEVSSRSGEMIKTIKTTKKMTFRELMEYIIQNDVNGDFKSVDGTHRFTVKNNGKFLFDGYLYGLNETYEVEVEETITEDTVFDVLVEVFDEDEPEFDETSAIIYHNERIKYVKNITTKKIYALIDGELQLVWERGIKDIKKCTTLYVQ